MKPEIEKIDCIIVPVYDLEKGKEGGIYSSVNSWITKENCPIVLPAEQEIRETKVVLVSFGYRSMKTEEVSSALDEINMAPAGLPHLLGVGMKHSEWHIPKNNQIGRIIALGETFPYKNEYSAEDDSVVLYMECPSILSRNLCIASHKNVCWYVPTSYFLALAK